jgi:hypothetical protein
MPEEAPAPGLFEQPAKPGAIESFEHGGCCDVTLPTALDVGRKKTRYAPARPLACPERLNRRWRLRNRIQSAGVIVFSKSACSCREPEVAD